MKGAVRQTIGVVFDLDQTLAPDTTTQYLLSHGVEVEAFWAAVTSRVKAGWDHVPAYLFGIVEEAGRGRSMTKEDMVARAKGFRLFPGVTDLIPRLRSRLSSSDVTLEFYLISSGIGPIVHSLPIAGDFSGIWTSDFEYNHEGLPVFPRRIVSFTDKTRPLIEISKGISQAEAEAEPFRVNERVGAGGFRIPFRRMVFVGDGFTDVPCFAMVTARGGMAIAVYDRARPEAEDTARRFLDSRRVRAIAEADYQPRSPAFRALEEAINLIADDRE